MFGGNPTRVWVLLADERRRFNKQMFRIEAPISTFDNLPYVIGYADHDADHDENPQDPEEHHDESSPSERHCTCGNTCAKCQFDTVYNMEVLTEANENLTASQKELLLDHQRLGHINMSHLQELYRSRDISCSFDGCSKDSDPCIRPRHSGVSSCEVPGCLACYAAKAKRRSTGAKHSTTDEQKQFGVSTGQLNPGDQVHVDNYESSIRGRLSHTYGKEPRHAQYCGGTIFYDAATGIIKVYHQSSLTGLDTVKSKRLFERDATQCGVTIKNYHADNGIFTGSQWKSVLLDEGQFQGVSGTGAHHQNPHAERAIQTVTQSARAMLLHLQIHWPDQYDTRLWPLALSYATWLYNHTPKRNGLAPIELFCGVKTSCEYLKRAKVFGAPVYVLDPKLQDGRKIPKWSTRSRRGMFLGFSPDHSSSVGLILNLKTGSITPQFHFVVDQKFTTVPGGQMDRTLPEITDGEVEFFIKSSWETDDHVDALDSWDQSVDGQRPTLAPEWNPTPISDPELENPIIPPQSSPTRRSPRNHPPSAPQASQEPPVPPQAPPAPDPDEELPSRLLDDALQMDLPRQHPSEGGDQDDSLVQGGLDPQSVEFADPVAIEIIPQDDPAPQEEGQPAEAQSPSRRSRRSHDEPDRFGFDREGKAQWKGQGSMRQTSFCDPANTQRWQSHPTSRIHSVRKGCYHLPRPNVGRFSLFKSESNPPNVLTTYYPTPAVSKAMRLNWSEPSEDPMANQFEYLLEACSCPLSEDLFYLHPFALQIRLNQATDQPTLQEILNMPDEERVLWFEAMNKELNALWAKDCFVIVEEDEAKGRQIVPLTWAFKVKTRPDGSFLKRKARLCLRGDKMIEGLEEGKSADETSGYAPVVDWGTIRMLLTMSVNFDLKTTAVDFRNAFTQKKLDRPHYSTMPPMIADFPEYQGKILRVKRSLYGSKWAAKLYYELLRDNLTKPKDQGGLGFKMSENDHCMFIRDDAIFIVWVDDGIALVRDSSVADKIIDDLNNTGMSVEKEGEDGALAAYLGVTIESQDDGSLVLKQEGLIDRIIEATGMQGANPKKTPATEVLVRHKDAEPFDNSYNMRSVVGMLNYLAGTSHPEISFAVHQCSRFQADPKKPHAAAIKRIVAYLIEVKSKGMVVRKFDKEGNKLNAFVDADFAGLQSKEDPQDPTSCRSRTGYIICVGDNPIYWGSRLQSEIADSTMAAEYIAASYAMKHLVYLRRLHQEISQSLQIPFDPISNVSTIFEDNQSALLLATADPPRLTPRSKSIAVKYHWFRQHLGTNILMKSIDSPLNRANILTKPLPRELFERERHMIMGF